MVIVEFVGVAGAGKTTLAQYLSERDVNIQRCLHPNVRSLQDFPFFLKNFLRLGHRFFSLHKRRHWVSLREFAWLAVLRGWPETLRKQSSAQKVLILDQGPIFLTAELHHFEPQRLQSSIDDTWWREIYRRWSLTLDWIIYLDAEDSALYRRVQRREKEHEIKYWQEDEAVSFLQHHRAVYEQAVLLFSGRGDGPKVLRIHTGQNSPDVISCHLLDIFQE